MKKELKAAANIFPMPVLIVAAYDENEKVNAMNVAWGQACAADKILLCIGKGKKTLENIQKTKAFTVSFADTPHMDAADFYGIATGMKMDDKFERTGYTAVKSDKVNAPVIDEFPFVLECEFLEEVDTGNLHCVVGKVVGVKAEESVLDAEGKVDITKMHALMFDQFKHGYYEVGEHVGQAWDAGMHLMK